MMLTIRCCVVYLLCCLSQLTLRLTCGVKICRPCLSRVLLKWRGIGIGCKNALLAIGWRRCIASEDRIIPGCGGLAMRAHHAWRVANFKLLYRPAEVYHGRRGQDHFSPPGTSMEGVELTLGEINCSLIGGQILDQFLCSLRCLIKLILQFPTAVQLKLQFNWLQPQCFHVIE